MRDDDRSPVYVAACSPWAFTQTDPLNTSALCREAAKRGVDIKEQHLRELWRVGALAPFVEVRRRRLHEPATPAIPEPSVSGTWSSELRRARNEGRLADAAALGFRAQLHFTRPASVSRDRHWWNGLLYSRWQLLDLYDLRHVVHDGTWRRGDRSLIWRSRALTEWEALGRPAARRLTAVLVALEARYIPQIEAGVLHLMNTDMEEWEAFAGQFDPEATLHSLGWDATDLLRAADDLLIWLHRVDPLRREWSELARRAPQRSWDDLQGDALAAMDKRVAAEILLRCYEDLAARGLVPPLASRTDVFHREAQVERISHRAQSLDVTLSRLGLSPHPSVVLVVEGETEEIIVPRVREHIRIPVGAEVIRSVVLRGVRHDLTKLAAFACAPLIERPQGDGWLLVKPPTHLLVLVDSDRPFDTAAGVENERQKIVDEMVAVVRSQGVEPDRGDLESLVDVSTWTERCFEFAHFTDSELAETLLAVHPNCNGLDRESLVEALRLQRTHRQDIKNVWKSWHRQPSKTALAKELWPLLRVKLDAAAGDSTLDPPPIALRLLDAFSKAFQRPRGAFLLRGVTVGDRAPGGDLSVS